MFKYSGVLEQQEMSYVAVWRHPTRHGFSACVVNEIETESDVCVPFSKDDTQGSCTHR